MKRLLVIGLTISLICLTGLTLSACSGGVNLPKESISLGMALYHDGSVCQEVAFSLQSEKLKEYNVKETLIEEVKDNMISSVNNLRNEFYISLLITYSNLPNPTYKIGDAVKITETEYFSEYDIVSFQILYKDLQTWQYYHEKQTEGSDNLLQNSNIKFFERVSSEGAFPFSARFIENNGNKTTIGERYLNLYKNAFNKTLANNICDMLETPCFVYDYATPFANLRSNADIETRAGEVYHNVWIKNVSNFKEATIKITTTMIYTGWWYLTLLVSIIFIFILSMIGYKFVSKKRLF